MLIPSVRIGKFSIYNVLIIFSIILGGIYLITRKEYTIRQKIVVSITTIVSGLIGARVYYAIINYNKITVQQIFTLRFMYPSLLYVQRNAFLVLR